MHSASSLSLFLIINLSFEIFPTAFKVPLQVESCSPPPIRTNFDRKFNNHPHVKVKFQFFEFAIKWQIFFEYFCAKILYRWNLFKSRNIEFWIERIKFYKTLISKTKMTRVDPPVSRPYSWKIPIKTMYLLILEKSDFDDFEPSQGSPCVNLI